MTLGVISFFVSLRYLNEPAMEQNYNMLEDEYINLDETNMNNDKNDLNETSITLNNTNSNNNRNDTISSSMITDSLSSKKDLPFFESIKLIFSKSSWIAIVCYCLLSLATMLFFTVRFKKKKKKKKKK